MKLELHVHTRFSKDSVLCIIPLYLKCRLLGIKGIAITDHNSIDGAVRFKHFCEKYGNKVTVIIGEEIFSADGEIIGLFLNKEIQPGLSPEKTIKEIQQQQGIVYVPHPFDTKRQKTVLETEYIDKFREMIDFIEVHNGRNISDSFDISQNRIANHYGITPVIGSDAHTLIEIGRNYHEVFKIPSNSEEFRNIMPYSNYVQKRCIKITHTITKFVKAFKILGTGGPGELYRIIIGQVKKNMPFRGKRNRS